MSVLKRLETLEKSKPIIKFEDILGRYSTDQLKDALENPTGQIAVELQNILPNYRGDKL